ncbi:tautomerase family protein [Paenibacillus sp. ACRRX]|uniref:tautomerase family protein n=1 Tax=Paenibacillus sp. ACRRX TaxID=2918206 RepID=UPI001EF61FE5|nr:tautomerase family protein [Paenibacillus sp. ACRRX]MCG7409206.1 tautomerase family protein [Paenibacillus sp. ACRRX]
MPFVRIDLIKGKEAEELLIISQAVHLALTETIDVPMDDYFQVITQHEAHEFNYDPQYMNICRTNELLYIQITLKEGRSLAKKKALYARMAELLQERTGIRPADVMIILLENTVENWSFGNGIAQLAPEK